MVDHAVLLPGTHTLLPTFVPERIVPTKNKTRDPRQIGQRLTSQLALSSWNFEDLWLDIVCVDISAIMEFLKKDDENLSIGDVKGTRRHDVPVA